MNATKRFEDWTLILEAKNGGLLVADNASSFAAPENGYVSTLQFAASNSIDLRWSQSSERRRLYFRGRNNRVSALLSLQFDVHPWEGGRLRIESLVNASGSRNLEPDSEKQITDPVERKRFDALVNADR